MGQCPTINFSTPCLSQKSFFCDLRCRRKFKRKRHVQVSHVLSVQSTYTLSCHRRTQVRDWSLMTSWRRRWNTTTSHQLCVTTYTQSRLRHRNMILAGAPRSVTDRLQRVLNAAARHASSAARTSTTVDCRRFCMLDVADRVRYKLAVTVHQCLHNKAPKYLADCCVAVSNITGR